MGKHTLYGSEVEVKPHEVGCIVYIDGVCHDVYANPVDALTDVIEWFEECERNRQ